VGAWGPGIFSDDTAHDVRGDYRELLEERVADEDATARVVARYEYLDADEAHVLWLALAAAQHQVGRLDEDVKRRAVAIIDSGEGLERWAEAGTKALASRKAALAALREQLTGPQPARKTLRRPWRHVTDLVPGTVLAFSAATGATALFRVLRVDEYRLGAAPVLERLDWYGTKLPSARKLTKLRPREVEGAGGSRREERYVVFRFKKSDLDWGAAGFSIARAVVPRPQDATVEVAVSLMWRGLADSVSREFERGGR
jgi:hypothetical protein